jgi:hypothetical protein
MRPITVVAAAVAGLAFWRRKTLKQDTQRAKDATAKVNARLRGAADTEESTEEEAAPADVDERLTQAS